MALTIRTKFSLAGVFIVLPAPRAFHGVDAGQHNVRHHPCLSAISCVETTRKGQSKPGPWPVLLPRVRFRAPLVSGSRRIIFGYIFERRAGTFRVAWLPDGMIYVYVSEPSETL